MQDHQEIECGYDSTDGEGDSVEIHKTSFSFRKYTTRISNLQIFAQRPQKGIGIWDVLEIGRMASWVMAEGLAGIEEVRQDE